IIKDLKSMKNKRIVNIGNGKRYIFFKNYREVVMVEKEDGTEVLITVIKHKRDKKEEAINKRLQEKKEYESSMNEDIINKDKKKNKVIIKIKSNKREKTEDAINKKIKEKKEYESIMNEFIMNKDKNKE